MAFQELLQLAKRKMSEREVTTLLEIPNSTMQSWRARPAHRGGQEDFFSTVVGAATLQRIVVAAQFVISYGKTGVGGLQEFLELSGLNQFVAASTGAIHRFVTLFEQQIVTFGEQTKRDLSEGMRRKKIAVALDETFPANRICLVAIEVVSNFILTEKYSDDRTTESWKKAMQEALEGLNVEVSQSPSDEGQAITAYVKNELGAQHSPDLFHVQQELSRATAGPLKAQVKEFEAAVERAVRQVKKISHKHGEESKEAAEAKAVQALREYGLKEREDRQAKVRAAIKRIGKSYHPVSLKTGNLLSTPEIKKQLEGHYDIIEEEVQASHLKKSCLDRLKKAKKQLGSMVTYATFFFMALAQFVRDLELPWEEEAFFQAVIVPYAYLKMHLRKASKEEREELGPLIEAMETKIREGPLKGWEEKDRVALMKKGSECAEMFQRSSSCVEGRNGVLSLRHHSFQQISGQKLKALTVVHNYHTRRQDGSTAGERFFEKKHASLFEWLVRKAKISAKPRRKPRLKTGKLAA